MTMAFGPGISLYTSWQNLFQSKDLLDAVAIRILKCGQHLFKYLKRRLVVQNLKMAWSRRFIPNSETMPSLLTHSMDRKHFDEVRKAEHVCREALLLFRWTTCCFYDQTALTSNKFPSSKQRNLPICVPLWQSVRWSHVSTLRRAN